MTSSLPLEYRVKQVTKLNFLELFQILFLYIPDFITLIICYVAAWLAIIAIFQVELGILKSFVDVLIYLVMMPLFISIIIIIFSCIDIAKLYLKRSQFSKTKANRLKALFVLKNRYIVGFIFFYETNTYSFVSSLRVKINYRKKGLGSYLVNQAIQEAIRPIFLIPTSESFKFYTNLGFEPVSIHQLPKELKFSLGYLGLM